jgi:hypothetical protein
MRSVPVGTTLATAVVGAAAIVVAGAGACVTGVVAGLGAGAADVGAAEVVGVAVPPQLLAIIPPMTTSARIMRSKLLFIVASCLLFLPLHFGLKIFFTDFRRKYSPFFR